MIPDDDIAPAFKYFVSQIDKVPQGVRFMLKRPVEACCNHIGLPFRSRPFRVFPYRPYVAAGPVQGQEVDKVLLPRGKFIFVQRECVREEREPDAVFFDKQNIVPLGPAAERTGVARPPLVEKIQGFKETALAPVQSVIVGRGKKRYAPAALKANEKRKLRLTRTLCATPPGGGSGFRLAWSAFGGFKGLIGDAVAPGFDIGIAAVNMYDDGFSLLELKYHGTWFKDKYMHSFSISLGLLGLLIY